MPENVVVDGRPMKDHGLTCPDCGDSMAIMKDKSFIGYRCRSLDCRGSHAAHPDGRPVGTPADARTRRARVEAHEAFDRVWKYGRMSRDQAYLWMQESLGIKSSKCHIGSFDVATCRKLVQTVKNCYPELFPFDGST